VITGVLISSGALETWLKSASLRQQEA